MWHVMDWLRRNNMYDLLVYTIILVFAYFGLHVLASMTALLSWKCMARMDSVRDEIDLLQIYASAGHRNTKALHVNALKQGKVVEKMREEMSSMKQEALKQGKGVDILREEISSMRRDALQQSEEITKMREEMSSMKQEALQQSGVVDNLRGELSSVRYDVVALQRKLAERK